MSYKYTKTLALGVAVTAVAAFGLGLSAHARAPVCPQRYADMTGNDLRAAIMLLGNGGATVEASK
jgi:hypothetical protein